MEAERAVVSYTVPTYEAPPEAAWYHFLHGNVPGHQIDFMYRPEVPQGALTRQHFSHLARLMRYIEPREASAYAFAIANLSRDDTQYEPGRGGVAFIFGLRIQGAKDHAGRHDPPFSHAAAAIERHMDEATFLRTALAFYDKLLADEVSQAQGSGWYHTYLRSAQNPEALLPLLRGYLEDFDDLPAPLPSQLGFRWTVEGSTPPKRVSIVYPDAASFETIARCAARIAGVLVESDIRWTSISNGREADVPGGVSIRFVPEREAGLEEAEGPLLGIDDVPEDSKALADALFRAKEVQASQVAEARATWRRFQENKECREEIAAEPRRVQPMAATTEEEIEVEPELPERVAAVKKKGDEGAGLAAGDAVVAADGKKNRERFSVKLLVGLGVVLAVGGALAAVALHEPEPVVTTARGEGIRVPVVPVSTGNSAEVPNAKPPETASPGAPAKVNTVPVADGGARGTGTMGKRGPGRPTKGEKPPSPATSSVIVVPE